MKNLRWMLLSVVVGTVPGRVFCAEVASAKGPVEIKRSGAALWTQVKPKDAVAQGDVIRTGAGAAAEVRTGKGHAVSIKEKTTARVESDAKGDSRFYLEVGKLRAKVAKLQRGERFEVRTPLAVASVRGTVFEVDVAEDQTSRLSVFEGAVNYKELQGLGQETLVPAGQEITFTPPPAPPSPGKPEPGTDRKPGKDGGSSDERKDKTGKEDERKVKQARALDKREKEEERRRGDREGKDRFGKEESEEKERPTDEKESAAAPVDENPAPAESLVRLPTGDFSFDLKEEIMRETFVSLEKEIVQADVAQDLRTETYQDGNALIDAFGRRVRMEEYMLRPTENSYAYLSLAGREGRVDTFRREVVAANPLPKDLSTVNLFEGPGLSRSNWAVSVHEMSDNGFDFVRSWAEGGQPVSFPGLRTERVVFDHMYQEAGNDKGAVLLSHWVPNGRYASGDHLATFDRDITEILGTGTQNIPNGYEDYLFGGRGAVGDDRTSYDRYAAGLAMSDRLRYLYDPRMMSYYQQSEGYTRDVRAFFDGRDGRDFGFASAADRDNLLMDTSRLTLFASYLDVTGARVATLETERIVVRSDGSLTSRGKGAPGGFLQDGVNLETVFSSKDLFAGGNVDTMMTSLASRNGVQIEE